MNDAPSEGPAGPPRRGGDGRRGGRPLPPVSRRGGKDRLPGPDFFSTPRRARPAGPEPGHGPGSEPGLWAEWFAAARQRREELRAGPFGPTDAVRLLDGAGDGPGFDDLFVDDLAGRWVVQTRRPDQPLPGWLREVVPAPRSICWKRLDQHERRPPAPWAGEEVSAPFTVVENGLRYRVDLTAGYSQGLFLDQRDNRAAVRAFAAGRAGEAGGAGPAAVLNAFAYTCAFSVAAAAAGAHVVSVDLSRAALDWGRENFRLNGLDPGEHEFLAGDVFDWLRRLAKKGRRFALVVLDPPTFSRDRDGKVFRAAADYGRLAAAAGALVAPGGALLGCTNQRGQPPGALARQVRTGLGAGWRHRELPMPADFPGEAYLQSVWAQREG